jgi:hypothetical protein
MDAVFAVLPLSPQQALLTESEFVTMCVGGWPKALDTLFGCTDHPVDHHTALLRARAVVFGAGGEHGWAYSTWMSAHTRLAVRLFSGGAATAEVYPRFDITEGPHRGIDAREIFHALDFCSASATQLNTADACSHVISKGLPKRCQIRELNRFLASYAEKQDTKCVVLIRTMLISTLCGLYPHCREKLPFSVIVRVVASLSQRGSAGLVSWLLSKQDSATGGKGNAYTSQAMCFYAIREFIVHTVSNIPSLRACLLQHAQWGSFEHKVITTCEHTRRSIAKNAMAGGHSCALFTGVGGAVSSMHRTQRRKRERPPDQRVCPPQPTQIQGYAKLEAFLKAIPKTWPAFLDECRNRGCTPISVHAAAIEKMAATTQRGVMCIIPRLEAHGVGAVTIRACREIIACIHSGGGLSTFHAKLKEVLCDSLLDYALLENELMSVKTQLGTATHSIPERWSVAARRALDESWDKHMGPHAGCVTFCGSCKEVKCAMCEGLGSVRRGVRKREKQNAPVALARVPSSIRACVDEDSMQLFCDRIHNSQGSACRAMKIMSATLPVRKCKNVSSIGTYLANAICASWCKTLPLVSVQVADQILSHDSTLFVLCSVCSCVTRIGKSTGAPMCNKCAGNATVKTVTCVCCANAQTTASVIVSSPTFPAAFGRVCSHCSGTCVVKGKQVQELCSMRARHASAALHRDTRATRSSNRARQPVDKFC